MVEKEVAAVLIALVRRHCRAVGAAVRRAGNDEVPGAVEEEAGPAAVRRVFDVSAEVESTPAPIRLCDLPCFFSYVNNPLLCVGSVSFALAVVGTRARQAQEQESRQPATKKHLAISRLTRQSAIMRNSSAMTAQDTR